MSRRPIRRGAPTRRRGGSTTLYELTGPDGEYAVDAVREGDGFRVTLGDKSYFLRLRQGASDGLIVAEISDRPVKVGLIQADGKKVELVLGGERLSFKKRGREATVNTPHAHPEPAHAPKGVLAAPMPGRVIGLMARTGDEVELGDPLVVIESMKMETAIRSDRKGTVDEILVTEGSNVKRGQALLKFRD